MAENSKIEWTDHTFNPWIGCTKVSDGCKHCYAETLMDKRMGKVKWGPEGTRVRTSAANWKKPLTWNKQQWFECPSCGWRGTKVGYEKAGMFPCPVCDRLYPNKARQRVFCASLADVFEIQPGQPEMAQWRMDLFELIRQTPNLDWLLLTKRPENVMISEPVYKAQKLPDNVWIGTSVENQETANKRIPELLKIPARVRFLSMEPLLGQVDIRRWLCCPWCGKGDKAIQDFDGGWYHTSKNWARPCPTDSRGKAVNNIGWVIVGGESGHNARPMHPDWARSIRDQCVAAGVPFHFKQWGEWLPMSHITQETENAESATWAWPWANGNHGDLRGDTTMVVKVGKHAAGRLLDGRTWDEFPAVQP